MYTGFECPVKVNNIRSPQAKGILFGKRQRNRNALQYCQRNRKRIAILSKKQETHCNIVKEKKKSIAILSNKQETHCIIVKETENGLQYCQRKKRKKNALQYCLRNRKRIAILLKKQETHCNIVKETFPFVSRAS